MKHSVRTITLCTFSILLGLLLAGCHHAVLFEELENITSYSITVLLPGSGSKNAKSITMVEGTTSDDIKSFKVVLDDEKIQYASASDTSVTFSNVSVGEHSVKVYGAKSTPFAEESIALQYENNAVGITTASKTVEARLAYITSGNHTGTLSVKLDWSAIGNTVTSIDLVDAQGNVLATNNAPVNGDTNMSFIGNALKVTAGTMVHFEFKRSDGQVIGGTPTEVMTIYANETSSLVGYDATTEETLKANISRMGLPVINPSLSTGSTADSLDLSWKMPSEDFTSITHALYAADNTLLHTTTALKDSLVLAKTGDTYHVFYTSLPSDTEYHATLMVTYTTTEDNVQVISRTTQVTGKTAVFATGVKINPLSASDANKLIVGSAFTLSATMSPANATAMGYVWKSSDENVIKVKDSTQGTFEVTGYGNATITVTAKNRDQSASLDMAVSELAVGDITTTLGDTSITLSWTSSEKADSYELYRSVNNGAFTLLATTTSAGYTDKALATSSTYSYEYRIRSGTNYSNFSDATQSITTGDLSISITKPDAITVVTATFDHEQGFKLKAGDAVTVKLKENPAGITTYTWYLNAIQIATQTDGTTGVTIDGSTEGLYTWMINGQQHLMVAMSTAEGITYSNTLNFWYMNVEDTAVALSAGNPASVKTSDTGKRWEAIVTMNDGSTHSTVNWKSSDTSIATISEEGLIKALKDGEVTITASSVSNPALTASSTLTCIQPVTGITSKKGRSFFFVDGQNGYGKTNLTASVLPEGATNKNISYSSNDESIIKVDAEGNISAGTSWDAWETWKSLEWDKNKDSKKQVGKPGKAIITATTEDGAYTENFEVTVYAGGIWMGDAIKTVSETIESEKVACTGALIARTYHFTVGFHSDEAATLNSLGYSVAWAFADGKTEIGALDSKVILSDVTSPTMTLSRSANDKNVDVIATIKDADGTIVQTLNFLAGNYTTTPEYGITYQ